MKRTAFIASVCAVLALGFPGIPADDTAQAEPLAAVPVLVELFTSEGCSSCPPADRLLSELLAEQPVPGVRIIALGEHVDYWNELGWPDRFASESFTARQAGYRSAAFPASPIYTPQVVVDGSLQCVGSDAAAVRRAIVRAARAAKTPVEVALRRSASAVAVTAGIPAAAVLDAPAELLLAVIENRLATQVARGENKGRFLEHDAVVRRLERLARLEPGDSGVSFEKNFPIDEGWKTADLEVVAIVQDAETRRVLGAAAVPLASGHARK
jgi:hypothetical protein